MLRLQLIIEVIIGYFVCVRLVVVDTVVIVVITADVQIIPHAVLIVVVATIYDLRY